MILPNEGHSHVHGRLPLRLSLISLFLGDFPNTLATPLRHQCPLEHCTKGKGEMGLPVKHSLRGAFPSLRLLFGILEVAAPATAGGRDEKPFIM